MIDYEYKDLFGKDSIDKQIVITYDGGRITNKELHSENFELTESICSDSELRFGRCEASVLKFRVSNVINSTKGKELLVTMSLDGNDETPFQIGKFKVATDVPTADKRHRDITAYDALYDIISADVAEWYNKLRFPMSLKLFRNDFFAQFGVQVVQTTLPNDNMTVERTIEAENISGRDVINAICEINGCFGRINRDGKFEFVFLKEMIKGLYPADDVYPSNTLYPADDGNVDKILKSQYESCNYEDFYTGKITKVLIRQEEDAIGAEVGTDGNTYVIEDNFLLYGKSNADLTSVGNNFLNTVKNITYMPAEIKSVGNPCIEVGNGIVLSTKNDIVYTYVLSRTLKGIQSLRDTYKARGTETYTVDVNSTAKSITQLKGKISKIEKDADGIRLSVEDLETNTSSQITMLSNRINLKVSAEEVQSMIDIALDEVVISSKQIRLEGYTTINGAFSVDSYGNVLLSSGDSNARMTDSAFYIGNSYYGTAIKPSSIGMEDRTNKRLVEVAGLYNNGSSTNVIIGQKSSSDANFTLEGYKVDAINGNFVMLSTTTLTCNAINGATPVTLANINNYIPTTTSQLTASTTEYGNIDFGGSVNGASVTYVQENFARQSALAALEARVSALEG